MDAISLHHPDVDMIWNVWPFTLIFWMPYRLLLNLVFGAIYIPLAWTWYFWDLFWESFTGAIFWLIMAIDVLNNVLLFLFSWLIFPIPLLILGLLIQFFVVTVYLNTVTLPTWITWLTPPTLLITAIIGATIGIS